MNLNDLTTPIQRKFKEDICPICMDTIKNLIALNPCLHEFCLNCIGMWLVKHFSCPKCKQIPYSIIYKVTNDFFHSFITLNVTFVDAWMQRGLIMRFFSTRSQKMQTLRKRLRFLFKDISYSVDFQRKLLYFCGMKTTLFKKYKTREDFQQLSLNSSHKIWQWLKIELSVFYTKDQVDKILRSYQSDLSTYSELVTYLSMFIRKPVLKRFLEEMDAFLSFFGSCENYYDFTNIKMVSGKLPENVCDSVIIDAGAINLGVFSRLLVHKIFELELENVDINSDKLMAVYEISHVNHITDTIVTENQTKTKDDCIAMLTKFMSLRLRRSISSFVTSNSTQYSYGDYFNLIPEYAYIYLSCYRDQIDLLYSTQKSINPDYQEEVIDLTNSESMSHLVIDLTNENDF